MLAAFRLLGSWRPLRRVALPLLGVAAVTVGVWLVRDVFLHRAVAQQAGPAQPAPLAAPTTSDYASRIVAYLHNNQAITRQDLGEYLILRYGADKLPLMLNQRLLDKTCAERGIVVNAAEVDAALARDLQGLAMPQDQFIKTVLTKYKKNLYEWKEDVLRPRLQMMRLVQDRLNVTQEELRKAYESAYGEKIDARIIMWPANNEKQVMEQYGQLRDSEAAFADMAKKQFTSALAAAGGKIRPFGRYTMDEKVEAEAFKLAPGQVTPLIPTTTADGKRIVMLKCDRRIPADTTVNFDAVKNKLAAEIHERKLQAEIASCFAKLRGDAHPDPLLKKTDAPPVGTPPPNQIVAYLYGNQPVTREQLGEFLIARYGGEKIEFLVNRRIIEIEARAKNINITEKDVDESLKQDLAGMGKGIDKVHFEKEFLAKWGKTLYEWREDVIRPKLVLTKLCEGRVRCTEDDLKKAYEAHYGERLACRMLLWPVDQLEFAKSVYGRIRDSEEEFSHQAKCQASSSLAAVGGVIPVFGRNTFGNEDVERAAFILHPGEVTPVIGTPAGHVVLKCDKRLPPDHTPLPAVREELTKEVLAKKVNLEMQVVFKELRDKASPRVLIQGTGRPEDLLAESVRLMKDAPRSNGKQPK